MKESGIQLPGPSRQIPAAVLIRLLFGGIWNQSGWLFFGFTSIFWRATSILEALRMDWGVALILTVIPGAGLALLAVGLRKGLRGRRLLRRGLLATGRLVSAEPTGLRYNDAPVVRLAFLFTLPDGKPYRATALSENPARLQDEAEEPLVYDGRDPEVSILLDDLPGKPRIDEFGVIRLQEDGRAWPLLVLPGLVVLGHLAWTLLRG